MQNDDYGTLTHWRGQEDVMAANELWLMPRTRVGQMGAGVSGATVFWAVYAGASGLALALAILVAVGIVWTAILRHGDAALVLWVLGIAGVGWLSLTIFG